MGKCSIYTRRRRKKTAIRKKVPLEPKYRLQRHILPAIINMLKELKKPCLKN